MVSIVCSNINCFYYNNINNPETNYFYRFVFCEICLNNIYNSPIDCNIDTTMKMVKRPDESCRKCKKKRGDAFYVCYNCTCELELILKNNENSSIKTLSASSLSDSVS